MGDCEDCGRTWPEHELTDGLCRGCWAEYEKDAQELTYAVTVVDLGPVGVKVQGKRPPENLWCGECGCWTNHTGHPTPKCEECRGPLPEDDPEQTVCAKCWADDPEHPDI